MKQKYLSLNKMFGLCKTCVGNCVRLEDVNFNGTDKCNGYELNTILKSNKKNK
jgi:hypothetical protein